MSFVTSTALLILTLSCTVCLCLLGKVNFTALNNSDKQLIATVQEAKDTVVAEVQQERSSEQLAKLEASVDELKVNVAELQTTVTSMSEQLDTAVAMLDLLLPRETVDIDDMAGTVENTVCPMPTAGKPYTI